VTTDNSTVVSLAIATNPVGGTLSCTSGLSRTVVNGVATFFGCSINLGSSSSYTLSATSSPAWTPATSSAFLIGTAQTLTFALQPGGGAPGAIWLQQPVVDVLNASSLVVTTDNSTVVSLAIATNPVGGTLSCTSGLSRTVVNGVATFFGCSINLGSSSYYTLSATSSPAWTPATSSAFLIGTAPAFGFNLTGTALGNTLTGPFTPGTKISHGGYISWRFDGGAAVAGQTIQIWAYKKSALFTNPWSAVYLLTTRVANASGVAYANITSHNVIWLSIRPVLPASGSTPAVWGPWSIGRWVH
jgi:hypothetical protein